MVGHQAVLFASTSEWEDIRARGAPTAKPVANGWRRSSWQHLIESHAQQREEARRKEELDRRSAQEDAKIQAREEEAEEALIIARNARKRTSQEAEPDGREIAQRSQFMPPPTDEIRADMEGTNGGNDPAGVDENEGG